MEYTLKGMKKKKEIRNINMKKKRKLLVRLLIVTLYISFR